MRKVNSAREEFCEEENPHPANPEKEAEWAAMLPTRPSRLSGHGRSPPTDLLVGMTLGKARRHNSEKRSGEICVEGPERSNASHRLKGEHDGR